MFRPRQNPPLDGTVPLSLLLPGNQRTPEYEPRITGMFLCSRQLLCRFRMWCASQRTVGTLVDAYVGRIASESSLVELGRVSFDSLGKSHSLQVNHAPNVHTPISHVLTPPPMSFSSWWCHPWSSCAGCGSVLDPERRRVVSRPHPQLTGTLL